MTEKSEILQADDVISFEEEQDEETERLIEDVISSLEIPALFRSESFMKAITEKINFLDDAKPMLTEGGIPCRILTPRHQAWIKGKVKLSLEFIPDKIADVQTSNSLDNPLDEIRHGSI